MEGSLAETPLASVLELLHYARQSGRIVVRADVPLVLIVNAGEVTAGGIFDWQGLEAVRAFDLHARAGRFRFEHGTPGPTLWSLPFGAFLTDWARHNDEWARIRARVDSPSRVLEAAPGADLAELGLAEFAGGRSVRAVARATGRGVFETAERARAGVLAGRLRATSRYAWHALRVRLPDAPGAVPPDPAASRAGGRGVDDVPGHLDGRRNLGDLIEAGFAPDTLRAYLAGALGRGDLRVAGRGWLLRDLTWELGPPIASRIAGP